MRAGYLKKEAGFGRRTVGDREVADATRLRELEHENTRLKRLLADAELDKAALKDLLETIKQ